MTKEEKAATPQAAEPEHTTAREEKGVASPLKSKKGLLTGGVVAAVIVLAAVGFGVWHEQPSFCNAICHTPMDGYLETYTAKPGEPAVDRYGNEVADAHGMLAAVHAGDDIKANCLSCHVPTIGEQMNEGMAWVWGDYTLIESSDGSAHLAERSLDELTAAKGVDGDTFCLNEDCHDLTRQELTELTYEESDDPWYPIRNPHSWQHGEVECSDCHKAHRASVLTCTECHADMELPEGWISIQEAKAMGYTD